MKLTLQCRPRCTVQTSNASYATRISGQQVLGINWGLNASVIEGLILVTNIASKGQMGFNLAFVGLNVHLNYNRSGIGASVV